MKASKFCWYELLTSDPAAALDFYQSIFGWQSQAVSMGDAPYTLISVGPDHFAGLMALPAGATGMQPSWGGYIEVEDVDAMSVRIQSDGGRELSPPRDIPGVGRFSVVTDPQGAYFYLFKNIGGDDQPANPQGTPGTVGWRELHAGNGVQAFDFYAKNFGWTKDQAMDMGELGIYQLFAAGADAVGGMMTKMPETPTPFWLYYFNVETLDAALDRVNLGGGKIVNPPMEVPGGRWIAQCLDPQGAMFALLAPKR